MEPTPRREEPWYIARENTKGQQQLQTPVKTGKGLVASEATAFGQFQGLGKEGVLGAG